MWALSMVFFTLFNPDLKYPYELDIDPDESIIDQTRDLLINHKHPN